MSRNGPKTPGWCRSQFLIHRHLIFAQDVRKQLVGICHNAGQFNIIAFVPDEPREIFIKTPKIKLNLMEKITILGVAIQSCRDMGIVRQAVARGLFMNVAQLCLEGHYVALDSGQHVHIHPSSVLFR